MIHDKHVLLVEQLSSLQVFNEIWVAQILVFCILFCRSLFVLFFWPLYCLSFLDWWLLITPLVSSDHPTGIFWSPHWYLLITPLVSSDYPTGIFWLPHWYLLITPLLSSDHPTGIFWSPHWYLLITSLVSSDHPTGIFKPFIFYTHYMTFPSLILVHIYFKCEQDTLVKCMSSSIYI
jgi:hypothetical protein